MAYIAAALLIRTCSVLSFPAGRRPAQRISSPMAAPHDTLRGNEGALSSVWGKKLTSDERNITLLLIQHSGGFTFKSNGCLALLSWLYLLHLWDYFIGCRKDI